MEGEILRLENIGRKVLVVCGLWQENIVELNGDCAYKNHFCPFCYIEMTTLNHTWFYYGIFLPWLLIVGSLSKFDFPRRLCWEPPRKATNDDHVTLGCCNLHKCMLIAKCINLIMWSQGRCDCHKLLFSALLYLRTVVKQMVVSQGLLKYKGNLINH